MEAADFPPPSAKAYVHGSKWIDARVVDGVFRIEGAIHLPILAFYQMKLAPACGVWKMFGAEMILAPSFVVIVVDSGSLIMSTTC